MVTSLYDIVYTIALYGCDGSVGTGYNAHK